MRRATWLPAAVAVLSLAAFLVAEIERYDIHAHATRFSQIGWVLFASLVPWWLWRECGVRDGVRRLARLTLVAAVAFAVLFAGYERAQLRDAGVEVDATYTFLGLGWFVEGHNPITFGGHTQSFAQFPLALLGHLPGWLIGFDRVGPVAMHVGIMLQIAMLLALATTWTVERSVGVQAATVALVAAIFSNRLTVPLYNLTGYAIPAVTVGVMFLVTRLGDPSPPVVFRRIGGLLVLAMLHHYPGFFFVLPMVALWLVAAPRPLGRVVQFVAANPLLVMTLALAGLCLAIHPQLLLLRLHDVTAPPSGIADPWWRVHTNWRRLAGSYPSEFVRTFFVRSSGSWHLLDIPPLGGGLAAVVGVSWLATALALGRRGGAYAAHLVLFVVCLLVLTAVQHLVTDFEDYRDVMLVIGATTPAIGVALVAPRTTGFRRAVLLVWALAVAAHGWVDLGNLVGRRYATPDYAPTAQAMMERVRRYWRTDDGRRLRGALLVAVTDEPFPISLAYGEASSLHGIEFHAVEAGPFCRDPVGTVRALLAGHCGPVGVLVAPHTCATSWREAIGWRPVRADARTTLQLFHGACNAPPRDPSSPEVLELS